jgi:hypothetical protein
MAALSGLFPAAVGVFNAGKYEAAARGQENKMLNKIEGIPDRAGAMSSPMFGDALRMGIQTKIDRINEGR